MAAEKVGVAGLGHERQRGERVVVAGEGGEEMNGVRDGKQAVAVGGGQFHRWGGDAVPLKRQRVGLMSNGAGDDDDDDAGAAGGSDERGVDEEDYDDEEEEVGQELEEEEEREEGEADELSVGEDDEVGLEEERAGVEEDEDEVYEEVNPEEEGVDDDLLVEAPMDRNGGHRGRAMAYEEAEMEEVEEVEEEEEEEEEQEQEEEEEEEGYEEDAPVVPDSPPMRVRVGGGRERSRDAFEGVVDASDGSQERRAAMMIAPSRGFAPERGQSSSGEPPRHRETVSKVAAAAAAAAPKVRGMVDTAPKKKKAKVAEVPAVVAVPAPLLPPLDHRHPHRNGGDSKPKKEKAPAAAPPPLPLPPPSSAAVPKRKPSAADALPLVPHPPQPRDRGRFASDNKARVTLERAREILAAVKAAMVKDPKRFSSRQPVELTRHVVENTSSSDYDESASPLQQQQQPPPSRVANQHHQRHLQVAVKAEAGAPKKRSRPSSKGEKNPASRKPKVEAAGYQLQAAAADDKALYRSRAFVGNDDSYKSVARIAAAAGDDREAYERKQFVEDNGYERQTTVVEKKVRKRKKGKDLDGMFGEPTLVPGSILRDESWTPPSSPFGLIQESLYTDPWKVLLSCMLLNKSAGRQMHKVIWDLFSLCPDAETAINMDTGKIAEKVYSLGLQNKRAKMIQRFSLEYLRGDWTNVTQLHGIGKYAADAYAIFCQGLWRDVEPDDHMLSKYWKWLCDTDGLGAAFTPDMV